MDKSIIERELRKGGALVLEGLDILDPGINAFCAKLEEALPCSMTNSVAFFSQKQNEAYDGHADSDDVLVVQLSGKKTWDIFEPQQRRYLGNDSQADHQLGPVLQQITMGPGDALYVRAGVPHRCHTTADHSLHIAFDLLDRTPNVDQITKEANQKYYYACAQPYVPAGKVVDEYIDLLKSPEFQVSLEKQTRQIRENAARFREQVDSASGVRFLSKFK
jgi:ribosomal protein L16 Arg81 hydroxylase